MKNCFYIFLITGVMIVFNSCQKNSDVVEPDNILKNTESFPELSIALPENICSDEEFEASLSISNNVPGNMELFISGDDGNIWKKAAETMQKKASDNFYLKLKEGKYKIKGVYSGFQNGRNLVIKSEESNVEVVNCMDCESLVLEPELEESDYLVNSRELKIFTAEVTVIACDQDYYDLVLKGELISGAVYKSSFPSCNYSGTVSWNIGTVKSGSTGTYKVNFEYKIPDAGYGTFIPITGGWTLEGKTRHGSTVKLGDNNEIFVQVK